MKYRVLVDLEVYDFLAALKRVERTTIRKRFDELAESSSRWEEFTERDSTGRRLGVTVCGRFAITFWEDFADRHIKILRIVLADR